MRAVVRRLRRLEEGLLAPVETEALRRDHEIVLDIRRRRAERLGLPAPDDIPEPVYRRGMSIAEIILASREQWRSRREAEGAGAPSTAGTDRRAQP